MVSWQKSVSNDKFVTNICTKKYETEANGFHKNMRETDKNTFVKCFEQELIAYGKWMSPKE